MKKIDTRGFSCPQPVVMVMREIKEGKEDFEVILDSEASRENVMRTLRKFNLKVEVREENEGTIYKVTR